MSYHVNHYSKVRYEAKYTLDQKDKENAIRLKRKYGHFSSIFITPLLMLIALYPSAFGPQPAGFLLTAALGIPIFLLIKWLSNQNKRAGEGYKLWKIGMELRESEYYGEQDVGWSIMNSVMFASMANDSIRELLAEPNPEPVDLWTCDESDLPLIDPQIHLKRIGNKVYDYTLYLEELAYRYMIFMAREGYRATIINFAEAFSFFVWEIGMPPSMHLANNNKYGSTNVYYEVIRQYPIEPHQKQMICSFDYTVYEAGACQWLLDIWENARICFEATKPENDSFKSLDSPTVAYYHDIVAMTSRIRSQQPPVDNHTYNKYESEKLYSFYIKA